VCAPGGITGRKLHTDHVVAVAGKVAVGGVTPITGPLAGGSRYR